MSIVALITDLFFVAKVKSTAAAVGVPIVLVRDVESLGRELAAGAVVVIIDLNATGLDTVEAVRACKAAKRPPRVIAYLSHVQVELAEAARTAGADLVLPRSKFSQDLPAILQPKAGSGPQLLP